MKYADIPVLVKTEDGILELTKVCTTLFDKVNSVVYILRNKEVHEPAKYREYNLQLAGLFSSLTNINSYLKAEIFDKEIDVLSSEYKRCETYEEEYKPKNAAVLAQKDTRLLRKLSGIIDGYCISCEKCMFACQTNLKSFER